MIFPVGHSIAVILLTPQVERDVHILTTILSTLGKEGSHPAVLLWAAAGAQGLLPLVSGHVVQVSMSSGPGALFPRSGTLFLCTHQNESVLSSFHLHVLLNIQLPGSWSHWHSLNSGQMPLLLSEG